MKVVATEIHQPMIVKYRVVTLLLWTASILVALAVDAILIQNHTLDHARTQARIAYEKDITYRRWNAGHGGVYVPVTEETRSNPYLAGHPERDITSPSGRRLTMVNPAYMTRQAHELAREEYDVRGHITSLNPIRPANESDAWERAALESFEKGGGEYSSLGVIDGKEYLRLMRPMVTENSCLPCHASQGYSEGDIRGGISVAVPMAPLRAAAHNLLLLLSLGHLLVWLMGVSGIVVGGRRLMESARELEEANRFKDLFTDIMSHDLISPAGSLKVYIDLLIGSETDPRKRDLLERARTIDLKLIDMIRRAALYSRLDDMKEIDREDLDLGEIIRRSIRDQEIRIREKGMTITWEPEGELPVKASPMIENVFSNLISNAVKFSPAESRIEVIVSEKDDSWIVAVIDHGEGIPAGDRQRLFRRFERLGKENVKGTGLGLAIAARIIKLHRGEIRVEDTTGGGATFFVILPRRNIPG